MFVFHRRDGSAPRSAPGALPSASGRAIPVFLMANCFHTNPSTKPMVLNFMKSAMRDFLYIERSLETTFEYEQFEIKEDGKKTGAVEGCHDDRVMSTSIGLYVCYKIRSISLGSLYNSVLWRSICIVHHLPYKSRIVA